ncbi:MAG: cytochrome C [Calditrichaeota bacterium]|nr:MAG: cytochrome C [Calditrichota bacterium]
MKKLFKWLAILVAGVVVLIIIAGIGIYVMSNSHFNKKYDIMPETVEIPSDSASVVEGRRLFVTRGCVDCHGENGEGSIFIDNPAPGTVVGVNLTQGEGGLPENYSATDYVRALRHGVGSDGRGLVIMPSHEYTHYNDIDIGRLVAYMQAMEPIDNELPQTSVGPIFRMLVVTGAAPILPVEIIDHNAEKPEIIPPAPTKEYGKYLSVGCIGCHGDDLSGGPVPGLPPDYPPGANLTPHQSTGIGSWTKDDFFKAMREGKRPDGSEINPFMPWPAMSKMTDTELEALWVYLLTVPEKEFGNR